MPVLRVAVLCSGRAPGLAHLLENEPLRGVIYDVVGVVTSTTEFSERGLVDAAGVPCATHDLRAYAAARGVHWRDTETRRAYDVATLAILAARAPTAIVCAGYHHILTPTFLAAHPERVVTVHDADLTIRDSAGRPRYRGLHATRDAVFAGETETRATAHLVTADLDEGPVIIRSNPFPVPPAAADARRWNATEMLEAIAYTQREWMLRAAFGPLLAAAIVRLAAGTSQRAGTPAASGGLPLATPTAPPRVPSPPSAYLSPVTSAPIGWLSRRASTAAGEGRGGYWAHD